MKFLKLHLTFLSHSIHNAIWTSDNSSLASLHNYFKRQVKVLMETKNTSSKLNTLIILSDISGRTPLLFDLSKPAKKYPGKCPKYLSICKVLQRSPLEQNVTTLNSQYIITLPHTMTLQIV